MWRLHDTHFGQRREVVRCRFLVAATAQSTADNCVAQLDRHGELETREASRS
jgi:hypothetical protein